jgi:hypothetical protein
MSDTIPTSRDAFKSQDWNDPFPATATSGENASRPDARSVGSYDNVTNRNSSGGNEERLDVHCAGGRKRVTFKEPHFENISPSFFVERPWL